MPRADDERGERLALIALAVAMAVSAATILLLGRDLTFWSDEIDWLTIADDFDLRGVLTPHGSHLIALPRVIYEGLPRIFGTSYLPFRILAIIFLQAGAVLTFVLLRRRVGAVVAVFPAIVLLFFGSAQDMTVSPLGIPFTLSIALGLGAFALVELNRPRTDLGAMALLILAGLAHTFGTICAFGVLVYLIADRGRRREAWIAIVPLALWVAWWIWARQFDQSITESSNLLGTPFFLVKAAGAALEATLGIPTGSQFLGDGLSRLARIAFDLVAVAASLALIWRLRRGPTGPWAWAYVATLLAFWLGVALSEGEGREPTTPRYLYFGAIMIFLIIAELSRGRRIPASWRPWLLALFAVSLTGNVALMVKAADDFSDDAARVRAEIAAILPDAVSLQPDIRLGYLPGGADVPSSPRALVEFADDVGSTGFTLEELLAQPEDVRRETDLKLVRALGVGAFPAPRGTVTDLCESYPPAEDGYSTFPLDGGLNGIRLVGDTGDPGAALALGRYADVPTVPVGSIAPEGTTGLILPADDLGRPWSGRAAGTVEVCESAELPIDDAPPPGDAPSGRDRGGSRR